MEASFLLNGKKEGTCMDENKVPSKGCRAKLEVDFSRRDFIKSSGYVGIVAHQSALRKGERIKIPQYDRKA